MADLPEGFVLDEPAATREQQPPQGFRVDPGRPEGIPSEIRAIVGSVDKTEDKLATLKKFYPKAAILPNPRSTGEMDFLILDEGGKTYVYNPIGLDWADVPSIARETAQAAGATLGAVGGGILGGPGGAMAGAAGGGMLGEEAAGAVTRALGAVDTRTPMERVADTAFVGGTAGLGQGLGQFMGAGGREGVRRTFRGGEAGRREIASAITDLEPFDVSPSLAQATSSPMWDTAEQFLSRTIGAQGHIRKVVERTTDRISQQLRKRSAVLAGGREATPEAAGLAAERGVGDFVQRTSARGQELFEELSKHLPDDAPVTTVNTRQALDDLRRLAPDLPQQDNLLAELSGVFASPEVGRISQALPREPIPYAALKNMRSQIGERIDDTRLSTTTTQKTWKKLYGAISQDMEAAARSAGPKASQAFDRANRYWAAKEARLEKRLEPLIRNKVPERIFKSLEIGGKEGASNLRVLRRSIPKDQWNYLAGTVIRRLGRAQPGQQGALGQQFSFNTFLTKWNNVSDDAKDVLFGGPGLRKYRSDLDALARASERVRESSQAFFNPSGTAQGMLGQTMVLGSVASGAVGAVVGSKAMMLFPAAVAMTALGANRAAALMTSPKFVSWLAQTTRVKPNGWSGHIGRLSAVAAGSDPETRAAVLDYLGALDQMSAEDRPQNGPQTVNEQGRRP